MQSNVDRGKEAALEWMDEGAKTREFEVHTRGVFENNRMIFTVH
jgi:hypothetical protein